MKTGIVGLPLSGKTTLFKALVGPDFQTLFDKPNIGSVKVPDPNIEDLAEFFKPKKKTFAEIIFVDIPGVPGGAENSKRRNEIYTSIRKVDALIEVIDSFSRNDVYEQIASFDSDLIIMDLDVVEKRLERLSKEKLDSIKGFEKESLEKCLLELNKDLPLRNIRLTGEEIKVLSSFEFLTLKPLIYLINVKDSEIEEGKKVVEELRNRTGIKGTNFISLPLKLESEITELSENEKKEFLSSYGLEEPALPEVIHATMDALNYNVFYTTGEDEVKSWLFEKGLNARAVAGKVHSDIERGFIAAEVISFEDFRKVGFSFKEAKSKGLLRIEGENYIVKNKEVVHFRFNV